MKKLNNKGYMIVEIIVSAIIAMTIAYFLFDLVIKLKEKYEYIQTDTVITADKIIVTNEILGDLYNKKIEKACKDGESIKYIVNGTNPETLRLSYDEGNKTIIYKNITTGATIYQKKLNDKLIVNNTDYEIKCGVEGGGFSSDYVAKFIIKGETLNSNKKYSINIIIPVPSCTCS